MTEQSAASARKAGSRKQNALIVAGSVALVAVMGGGIGWATGWGAGGETRSVVDPTAAITPTFEAAAPLTTFAIGPIAEFMIIPYMNTDAGRAQFGWLLGEGQARGIALVFLIAGLLGLILTFGAFATKSYRWLTERYEAPEPPSSADVSAADPQRD